MMINFYKKKKSKEGDSKRIRTKSERLKKIKGEWNWKIIPIL